MAWEEATGQGILKTKEPKGVSWVESKGRAPEVLMPEGGKKEGDGSSASPKGVCLGVWKLQREAGSFAGVDVSAGIEKVVGVIKK